MTLVDTSVWIDFLAGAPRAERLGELLGEGLVLTHPWIVGELAMGRLGPERERILADLDLLPAAAPVSNGEVRQFVEARRLHGSGLGWVDCQLLAAALVEGTPLWTFDRVLRRAAGQLGIP